MATLKLLPNIRLTLYCRAHKRIYVNGAGWSSLVARRAHNPKVTGSNPVPATNTKNVGVFCDRNGSKKNFATRINKQSTKFN